MKTSVVRRFLVVALVACAVGATRAAAQQAPRFSPAALVENGDTIAYGSYRIIRIGDGIYQIKDPGDPKAKAGGLIGVDMYLLRGASKALLIDLGNNYIDGYSGDVIPPRPRAAEELRAVVDGLRAGLPFEVAVTHAHPDHDGMTRAFADGKTTIWMPKGEDLEAPRKQHGNIDPSVYTVFDHATKTFALGGGRVVTPLLVRGHSNGCTTYLLAKDLMLFTGDSIGIGAGRSLRSAESLRVFAEDTQKLVEYLKANLAPYERYALKVYTGHSAENAIAGFYSANHPMLDLDYLDWRFVQDQALCANAILKGMWLVPDSGLRQMEVTNKQNGRRVNVMLYGIGAVEIALEAAYEAAGLNISASKLVKLGDEMKYGSYLVRKIGDAAYQINDPGDRSTKGGGWGVDMYLVCGTRKALLIDLGNNYISGYESNGLKPRPNAAADLRALVSSLIGSLPLEIAVTHLHPDHDGMAGAFAGGAVPLWAGDGEDLNALKTQHNLEPSIFRTFKPGSTSFDLGGGHIVETLPVRGHSNGGTVYLLKRDSLVFSGDALGSGFGQAFATVERLKQVAQDSQNLVNYIKANYAPYERYSLRVYTGHSWQNPYGGFLHPNKASIDVGYLDWRFIQDVSACANGILQGKWLVEGSGVKYMGTMLYTDAWGSAAGRAIMVSGIGTIILPLDVAHQAAGLPVPPELQRR